jgi:hypothetical protein
MEIEPGVVAEIGPSSGKNVRCDEGSEEKLSERAQDASEGRSEPSMGDGLQWEVGRGHRRMRRSTRCRNSSWRSSRHGSPLVIAARRREPQSPPRRFGGKLILQNGGDRVRGGLCLARYLAPGCSSSFSDASSRSAARPEADSGGRRRSEQIAVASCLSAGVSAETNPHKRRPHHQFHQTPQPACSPQLQRPEKIGGTKI